MAAERPEKSKKEKKEKKEKRSEEAGVTKTKKDKKEKKEKKEKLAAALDDKAAHEAKPAAEEAPSDMDEDKAEETVLERKLVPFAVPLADDKGQKKICKTIRKAAKNGTLKRGVKEVVKTLRKSAAGGPSSTGFPGVVIIAGDISPMDVISHIPVLCEDHNVPFVFVSSRAELGAAAKTKRPTSVVMIMEKAEGGKKKAAAAKADDDEKDDGEAYGDAYASLVKYAQKEYARQSFWAKGESKA
ncbi:H/ACA ribonucleoprotein complex subunit 2 [Escovopsis weberi]|uniref:H/ACA ribonucleoprotein complex subunit 2 n=1 Tax=Escovopsis weberi TaxID=150374 RepID=A0A0M9VXF1_ESCWE|nr:H/ACA ribonucleoprotein complex subunit 2 [Escovopsis weberi]